MQSNTINIQENTTLEEIESQIENLTNISFNELKRKLSNYVIDNATKIVEEVHNIIPYGDYSSIIEDKLQMEVFLKDASNKLENWELDLVMQENNLLQLVFNNNSVDDGEIFKGHIFISANGKIKHLFARID